MKANEFEVIFGKLRAAYPRDFRTDDEERYGLWSQFLGQHESRYASAAVNGWIGDHKKAPTIADVLEGIKLRARTDEGPKVLPSSCGHCDHGWEWVSDDTVAPCRNGCKPPPPDNSFRSVEGERSVTPERIQSLRDTIGKLNPGWRPTYSRTSNRRVR